MSENKNLWGGRFTDRADETFFKFNRSYDFDRRLFEADINGSLAHCRGLERAGVVSADDSSQIRRCLKNLLERSRLEPDFFVNGAAEDIHSFIETHLIAEIGDAGRKLHTGRSRNDQVATAMRIWTRGAIDELSTVLRDLQKALIELAADNIDIVIPGYTHLQKAQAVLFAHWCLAYIEMLRRDIERLREVRTRVNILPLGSAALAGTSFPIDRVAVAEDLGFEGVSRNSLDAVSDRDFCVEFVSSAALIMTHLSRLAEDIILYCTNEFGFFELSDAVATGSSIMPQKKNPDSMELVRGKTGRVFGDLMSLLAMLKSLPLAYNKDMQEDKEAVFDAFDTVSDSLKITAIVLRNIKVNKENVTAAASSGYLNATELADYLARKGVSFRTAHEIAGKIVLFALSKGVEIEELPIGKLQEFSADIGEDVFSALSLEESLGTKKAIGGTSWERVEEALEEAKASLF
ncbi:MAG: argininosuccinate lyase [Acidobacteria bacterium]|nr:argininosuccinate lyase [Acidobacteriota bacterium]